MAYGDYDGPNKEDKGLEGGNCNRTRCQAPDALWYNHGALSWYCRDCAIDIGTDDVNFLGWLLDHFPTCGHPMFETREEMDARTEVEEKLTEPDPHHELYSDIQLLRMNSYVSCEKEVYVVKNNTTHPKVWRK